MGDFQMQLDALEAMIPIFGAAKRHLYLKTARAHTQQMRDLSSTKPYVLINFTLAQ